MKLAFTTLGCPDWSLQQVAEKAAEYGYEGVELRVADDGIHLLPDVSPQELRRARQVFDDAGVPIISLAGYASFSSPELDAVEGNRGPAKELIGIAGGQLPAARVDLHAAGQPLVAPRDAQRLGDPEPGKLAAWYGACGQDAPYQDNGPTRTSVPRCASACHRKSPCQNVAWASGPGACPLAGRSHGHAAAHGNTCRRPRRQTDAPRRERAGFSFEGAFGVGPAGRARRCAPFRAGCPPAVRKGAPELSPGCSFPKRRGRDSNPRNPKVHRFSRPAHSAALAPLRTTPALGAPRPERTAQARRRRPATAIVGSPGPRLQAVWRLGSGPPGQAGGRGAIGRDPPCPTQKNSSNILLAGCCRSM